MSSRKLAPRESAKASPPDNAFLARCLANAADDAKGHLAHALKKASRRAHLWPVEAADVFAEGSDLTTLSGVGPYVARLLEGWITKPPPNLPEPEDCAEFLTMAQALRILALKPAWKKKLQGDLQMHTRWSDGEGEISDMAEAAMARGYRYISITDHTKGLSIAGGIDEKGLARQGKEIDRLNADYRAQGKDFVILKSAEVNLSVEGAVDMSAASLGKLDIVLGAFHSALRKSEDQTSRYLAAVRNPHIQILGHPQTRIYNYRTGLHADWGRVFGEAAKWDKAVEIDGYADRQDLRLSLLKIARREGVRISLGTDSHRPVQLEFMVFSLAAAAAAKIPPDRIINFLPAAELKEWAASVRSRARAL